MKTFAFLLCLSWASALEALTADELQSFVNKAIQAGGGEVIVQPGNHLLDRPLVIKDAKNLRFIGLDAEACVLQAGAGLKSLIELQGTCEQIRIEKLTLDATDAPTTIGISTAKAKVKGLLVSRCFLQNLNDGVQLHHCEGGMVADCTLRDIKGTGLILAEGTTQVAVRHNYLARNALGVALREASECLVEQNDLLQCTKGIEVAGKGHVVRANEIAESSVKSIDVLSEGSKISE